ncbi:MAG: glycosyltransferase [Syntrophobacteraceae bacterium]
MNHNRNRPRIMHLIDNLDVGGAQQCVSTLAKHWPTEEYPLLVCAMADGPMRSIIEQAGVPVKIIRRPRCTIVLFPVYFVELFRIWCKLSRLVKENRVALIQTHIAGVMDFVALGLRMSGRVRRAVWTIHGVDFLPLRPGPALAVRRLLFRFLYRISATRIDRFVAVSKAVRQAILQQIGSAANKIVTIPNGTSLEIGQTSGSKTKLCKELALHDQVRIILTVGRLSLEKGHRYLIEAAGEVVCAHPDVHFLIAGDGEDGEQLKEQARLSGCVENIHFLGSRTDVQVLLAAANLFVLPSLREGLSIALLEAMAAGLAVVATSIAGTREVVTPGETGVLVPPSNSAALARAITGLLRDPVRGRTMGRAARQHVLENYSAPKQAHDYLALYRELLEAGPD